ncbi:prepilin peptidase [Pseudomonas sp. NPDC090201]|jgi:prepilin peptidase CpaA|uniref:A24 family peptidase n=1 Tax=Pseudomonas sp. NPDC090201 TaxID=3364475 RepID=UPI00381992DD
MNLLFLLIWFAVCADQDARSRRVSNWLTFGGALFALIYLLSTGTSWLGVPMAQTGWGVAVALLLTLPGYALNRLGAGDVKLLVALALASGHLYILGTFIGAGVASLAWLLARQKAWPLLAQGLSNRYSRMAPQASSKQPFVPFLFAGFLVMALWLH